MSKRKIEIMDTTLRDGEQTSGVSFSVSEKLTISQLLLDELKVDRIEIASARVSEGEFEAVKAICKWAKTNGHIHAIEVLTFVDNGVSIKWMDDAGIQLVKKFSSETKDLEKIEEYILVHTPYRFLKEILHRLEKSGKIEVFDRKKKYSYPYGCKIKFL